MDAATTATAVPSGRGIRIALDRGGTFLDAVASVPGRGDVVFKLLAHDPAHYADAPTEAVRRILEAALGTRIPRGTPLDPAPVESIRLATTVATNALLERAGAKHALVTTAGFGDLLAIGNQSRPDIFDLRAARPEVLYSDVLEADERVTLVGATNDPAHAERRVRFAPDGRVAKPYTGPDGPPLADTFTFRERERDAPLADTFPETETEAKTAGLPAPIVRGVSGEAVAILRPLDTQRLRDGLRRLRREQGLDSLAVCLLHSFTFPQHEQAVQQVAREEGFAYVSISSALMPVIKAVSRGHSVSADAYLTPVLQEYIDSFFAGFCPSLRDGSAGTNVEFMMSDGGLTSVHRFSGLQSILSGPAGGVVGMALTTFDAGCDPRAVIGFDMGGTSTDVSRYAGRYEQVFESTTAGVTIASPQLDVNTVASGGSSRLYYRNGLFAVGPESASAHPGPAAYRKGGPLTITDANLVTGRLATEMFPRIFGPDENQSLDADRSRALFEQLATRINADRRALGQAEFNIDQIAHGFIRVANETMSRPIRALTEAKGYAAHRHILACFGGAGGQHACSLARGLGIRTVVMHMYSSLLSAYGMALADRVQERQEPCSWVLGAEALPEIHRRLQSLQDQVRDVLLQEGFPPEKITFEAYLNLRYDGTDTALMTLLPPEGEDVQKAFVENYKQEFGFILADKAIVVDDLRIKGIGHSYDSLPETIVRDFARRSSKLGGTQGFPLASVLSAASSEQSQQEQQERQHDDTPPLSSREGQVVHRPIFFENEGRVPTPILPLRKVQEGERVPGPAVLVDETQTLLIEPRCTAYRLARGVLVDVHYD